MEKLFSERKDLRLRYHLAGIHASKDKRKGLKEHKCQHFETYFRLSGLTK
jgi:hypothetical protein